MTISDRDIAAAPRVGHPPVPTPTFQPTTTAQLFPRPAERRATLHLLPASGRQHHIRHGNQRATVVQEGGGLREFIVDGHALHGFAGATNTGERSCRWGTGHHPYLTIGVARIDPLRLHVQARRVLLTDEQGQPMGTARVPGSSIDFSDGPVIGRRTLDRTFADLIRDPGGLAWIELTGPDHRQAEIWLDQNYRLVEVYTAHHTFAPGSECNR